MERRNTIQKQLVLHAVAQLADHPTADEVYTFVAKDHPSVSKATVYRNLASLSEDGRLRHIKMPSGADRFDHQTFEHDHIECVVCGRLADVPVRDEGGLDAQATDATGFQEVSHEIVFRGVCPACAHLRH